MLYIIIRDKEDAMGYKGLNTDIAIDNPVAITSSFQITKMLWDAVNNIGISVFYSTGK